MKTYSEQDRKARAWYNRLRREERKGLRSCDGVLAAYYQATGTAARSLWQAVRYWQESF
jgi:hypothetical protein